MKYSSNKFYCFSPPVMLATIIIELSLAIYTLIRYKLNPKKRLVLAILLLLATFQLAEYSVCGRFNLNAEAWSRVGFVAITMLPPLGLHLIKVIAGKSAKLLLLVAYLSALVWIVAFTFSSNVFAGQVCAGNYVIFRLTSTANLGYFIYYYSWLFVSIFLALYWSRKSKKQTSRALMLLVLGYLVFLVPTTVTNSLYPNSGRGIPSIMCGFAVLYAIILVFGVMPLSLDKRKA